jgi:hypothetical protein
LITAGGASGVLSSYLGYLTGVVMDRTADKVSWTKIVVKEGLSSLSLARSPCSTIEIARV